MEADWNDTGDYLQQQHQQSTPSASKKMDQCQKIDEDAGGLETSHKGQRPLLVGSFLLGTALSCFIYVNPSVMITELGMSENKANHLLALIFLVAAFTSPVLGFGNIPALMGISLLALVAIMILHIQGVQLHLGVVEFPIQN